MHILEDGNSSSSKRITLIIPIQSFNWMHCLKSYHWSFECYYFTESEIFRPFHLLHWPYLLSQVFSNLTNIYWYFLPQILLIKFQSISWRTSLHYLHPRRLEELHDLQVNNGQLFKIVKEIIWKTHILFFFSPPATVVFILFLLFEVDIRTTPDIKYFAASYVWLPGRKYELWWFHFRVSCLPCSHPLCSGRK